MKRVLPVYIPDDTRDDLETVAEAAHLNGARYAATIVSEFAQLKPEFALKALGLIPPEWKHRRPGRPTGSRTADRKDGALPEQNVA